MIYSLLISDRVLLKPPSPVRLKRQCIKVPINQRIYLCITHRAIMLDMDPQKLIWISLQCTAHRSRHHHQAPFFHHHHLIGLVLVLRQQIFTLISLRHRIMQLLHRQPPWAIIMHQVIQWAHILDLIHTTLDRCLKSVWSSSYYDTILSSLFSLIRRNNRKLFHSFQLNWFDRSDQTIFSIRIIIDIIKTW